MKAKLETDKQVTKAEMDDLSARMKSLQKSKVRGHQEIPQQTTNAATGAAISARQNSALRTGSELIPESSCLQVVLSTARSG